VSSSPGSASRTATTKPAEAAKETTPKGSRAGKDGRQEGSRAKADHEGACSPAESADPRGDRPERLRALALGLKPVRDPVANPGRPRGGTLRHSARRSHCGVEERRYRPRRGQQEPELRRTMARLEEPDAGEPARGHGRRRARLRPAPPPRSSRRAPSVDGCTSRATGRSRVAHREGVGLSTLGRSWGGASAGEPTAVQPRRADAEGGPN
jgi:hypothetical protein